MASKSKTREITIVDEGGTFNLLYRKIIGSSSEFDFSGIGTLRKILSNEKAKILYTVKYKNPNSIYHLAKILGRDFKSVSNDIKLLERFGFIDMIIEKTGKRERLKPVISADSINIIIKI